MFYVDGVDKGIRHTNLAPGDLFFDDRGDHTVVRPLSNQEKWNIMGLSPRKAEVLTEQGKECELGQLADNSIPSRMIDIVAAEAASRVAKFKGMLKARSEGGFVLMPPVVGLCSPNLHATF